MRRKLCSGQQRAHALMRGRGHRALNSDWGTVGAPRLVWTRPSRPQAVPTQCLDPRLQELPWGPLCALPRPPEPAVFPSPPPAAQPALQCMHAVTPAPPDARRSCSTCVHNPFSNRGRFLARDAPIRQVYSACSL